MKIPDSLLAQFQSILQKYPLRRSALIPILLTTQEELGYIPVEMIHDLARFVDVPEIDVHEVITFYSMLRTHPVGKHHIQVCTNISCMLLGGEEIFSAPFRKAWDIGRRIDRRRSILINRSRMLGGVLQCTGHAGQLQIPRRSNA